MLEISQHKSKEQTIFDTILYFIIMKSCVLFLKKCVLCRQIHEEFNSIFQHLLQKLFTWNNLEM